VSNIKCECGALYCSDLSDDVRIHKRQHDEWANGVKSDAFSAPIGTHGGYRFTIVPPTARLAARMVAERLGRIGNRETHYDGGVYHSDGQGLQEHQIHALLAWYGRRAIGILVLDRREREAYLRWDDAVPGHSYRLTPARPPRWSVSYAWVNPAHRRKGLASALFHAAASFAGVAVSDLGLLAPFTEGAEALARKNSPAGFWLV